jgi:hypothetical protein
MARCRAFSARSAPVVLVSVVLVVSVFISVRFPRRLVLGDGTSPPP